MIDRSTRETIDEEHHYAIADHFLDLANEGELTVDEARAVYVTLSGRSAIRGALSDSESSDGQ